MANPEESYLIFLVTSMGNQVLALLDCCILASGLRKSLKKALLLSAGVIHLSSIALLVVLNILL